MIIFLSYLAIPLQPVYMKIGWSLDLAWKVGMAPIWTFADLFYL